MFSLLWLEQIWALCNYTMPSLRWCWGGLCNIHLSCPRFRSYFSFIVLFCNWGSFKFPHCTLLIVLLLSSLSPSPKASPQPVPSPKSPKFQYSGLGVFVQWSRVFWTWKLPSVFEMWFGRDECLTNRVRCLGEAQVQVPSPKLKIPSPKKGGPFLDSGLSLFCVRPPTPPHPTHPQHLKGLSVSEWTSGYPKVYLSPFKHDSVQVQNPDFKAWIVFQIWFP